MTKEKILVMVNGLPGKMATEVANRINYDLRAASSCDINGIPFSLTGPEIEVMGIMAGGAIKHPINLIRPEKREEEMMKVKAVFGDAIAVDFTQPDAANSNAELYCRHGLNFVMGTTGGDRKALEERVKNSFVCAVIAPNMAKQIVAFQSLMEEYSHWNPGRLEGCTLDITESHQQGKKDTSGTAKAMVSYFNELGIDFKQEQIRMIREPETQKEIGVPEEYLKGHAWHTYIIKSKGYNPLGRTGNLCKGLDNLGTVLETFMSSSKVFSEGFPPYKNIEEAFRIAAVKRISPDGTVTFAYNETPGYSICFSHNVNGRSIYADGTLDAIKFLKKKVQAGEHGKVYSMIDVLNEGEL